MSLLTSFTRRLLLEKDEEKKKTDKETTPPEDMEPEELEAAPGEDEEASPEAEGPSIVGGEEDTADDEDVDIPDPETEEDLEDETEEPEGEEDDDVDILEPEGDDTEEETSEDETPEEDDVDVPEPEGDEEPTADDTPTEEPGAGGVEEVLEAPGAGNDETEEGVEQPPNFEDDDTNDAGSGDDAPTDDAPEGGDAGGDEADVDIPEPDDDPGAGGGDEEPDSGDAGDTEEEGSEGDEESEAPVGSIQADIKKIEDELFEELSPEQKAIKNKELKQQFVRLYYMIERFKEKVDTINKNSDNIQIISRVGDSLDKLSKLVKYYIIVTYNTKSYFENKSDIYYCLWALDRINKLICTITPEDSVS